MLQGIHHPYQTVSHFKFSNNAHCVKYRTGAWIIASNKYALIRNNKLYDTNDCRYRTHYMNGESNSGNGEADTIVKVTEKGVVWYEIAIQGAKSSKLNVEVTSGEYVSSILEKIKSSNSNLFEKVDVNQLEVYTSKRSKKPLDRADAWRPIKKWGNSKVPLLVVVRQLFINREGMISIFLRQGDNLSNLLTYFCLCVVDYSTLEASIDKHFKTYFIDCPEETMHIYNIQEKFVVSPKVDKVYWKDSVRAERFDETLENGILYRPRITNEIFNETMKLLQRNAPLGLMIKGPHGIGKSHSLVNVVWKLLSTGDYLVTFVPNCENWGNTKYLGETICASFGATYEDVKHLLKDDSTSNDAAFQHSFVQ
jgi:hypothetical protein